MVPIKIPATQKIPLASQALDGRRNELHKPFILAPMQNEFYVPVNADARLKCFGAVSAQGEYSTKEITAVRWRTTS